MSFDGRLLTGVSVLTAVIESGNFARVPLHAWKGESELACSTAPRARLRVKAGIALLRTGEAESRHY